MAALIELLGETLQGKDNAPVVATADALKDKDVVGLYFSAHWCPPCRMFTPMLAEWYTKLTSGGKKLEIIFVSSDRDQSSFDEYYAEHPWLALPFSDRDRKGALGSKFGVRGIPTLVFLDGATGKVITLKGRDAVMSDPEGSQFPYTPRPLRDVLAGPLMDGDGTATSVAEALEGKEYVGLYFSASWCPPCQRFTPVLAEAYRAVKEKSPTFEVVFVTGDRDESSFKNYIKKMPWKCIPFGDSRIQALNGHFEVEGIPTLIILDKDLKPINSDAVGSVSADPSGADFPWAPKPLTDLSSGVSSGGFDINSKPALVAFCEACDDDDQANLTAALLAIATEYSEAGKSSDEGPRLIFFTNTSMSGPGGRIRELTKIGDVTASTSAQIVLLDIPDSGAFYTYSKGDDFSEAAIRAFIDDYQAKRLPRKQLGR